MLDSRLRRTQTTIEDTRDDVSVVAPIARPPIARPINNAKIVIVDDDDNFGAALQALLVQHGYQHLTLLNDSRQAFDFIAQQSPDIVLLDLQMPDVSGRPCKTPESLINTGFFRDLRPLVSRRN